MKTMAGRKCKRLLRFKKKVLEIHQVIVLHQQGAQD